MLSTHILPEVQKTCSRVVIINEGQIVAADSIENLTAGLGRVQTMRLRVARADLELGTKIGALAGVAEVLDEAPGAYLVRVEAGDAAKERVAASVVASGAGLIELSRQSASLEEIFLKLVTEEASEDAA